MLRCGLLTIRYKLPRAEYPRSTSTKGSDTNTTLCVSSNSFHYCFSEENLQFQPAPLDRSPIDDTPLNPPLAPHLQPGYYAGLVITEAVGTKSGKTKIVELNINEANIGGYAIYENGGLARAVIVNLNAWLLSDEGKRERGKTHIDFKSALSNPKTQASFVTITVRRLSIGHADDLEGLLWGGQNFETSDLTPVGPKTDENVLWSDGVDVRETEAVLIIF